MAIFKSLVAIAALATASHAGLPEVEAILAGSDCSVYPGYDASTGVTGSFIIQTDSSTNPSIEGFGDSTDMFYKQGVEGIYEGYITIVYDNQLAKTQVRCNDNIPGNGPGLEAYVAYGVSGVAWQQINITSIPYSAQLMWGLPESATTPIAAYHHYIDGTQQPGLFLGSHNVTAWGIKYYEADAGSYGDPYWLIRLLGPDSQDPITGQPLDDGEYETFIKVEGS